MKITIVQGAFLPVPPLLGGAVEKVWQSLAREFASAGHEVLHVSRLFRDLPASETIAGVKQLRVKGHDAPLALWRLKLLDLAYSLRVKRVLPDADILVTNTFWLPVVERRKRAGAQYIHVARYPRGQLKLYPADATYQTVSTPIRDAIQAELAGRNRRVVVVPYPINAPVGEPAEKASTRVLLYAGRIHPEKGLELLVNAFRRFASTPAGAGWSLRLVGPWEAHHGGGGPAFRDRLLELGKGLQVSLPGPEFNHAKLVETYRAAELFVYPSLAEQGETFGLAVLEAMASGTAPIVSDLACFRDFVASGENGLGFDHRQPNPEAALADALEKAASDPALRKRLARQALETAKRYALPKVAGMYLNDFEAFLAQRTRS
jgi:glycosyltransferase involved in cell wall biosynthesis